jgi:2-hydroxychromene-2-carboxylate isomerase
MRTLRFYFDYISSNAYLAWVRLAGLGERFELRVEPVPVLFAALLEANGQLGPAEIRPKAIWMSRNCLRKAGQLGVRLKPPAFHPFNPLLPLRVSSLDIDPAKQRRLITRLFEGTWADRLATSEPEVVERLAADAGLPDPSGLVRSASSPEIKQRLRHQTDDAIARGVFGVPMFEVEGELFWGYDDFPYLELFLAGDDPLDPDEAKLWGVGPPRPSAMRRRFREEPPPSWQREANERGR